MKQLLIDWVFRAEGRRDAKDFTWYETHRQVRHELAFSLWKIAPNRLRWLIDLLDPFK